MSSNAEIVAAFTEADVDETAAPPATLAQVKQHLRVDDDQTDEDILIQAYLDAAIDHIDGPTGWLGRAIRRQALVEHLDRFDCSMIRLPYPPTISVESVELRGADGAWSAIAPDLWEFEGGFLMPVPGQFWPAPAIPRRGIRISFTAGYEEAPPPIVAAIMMMTADLYRQRETFAKGSSSSVIAVPMSASVQALLGPYRVYR